MPKVQQKILELDLECYFLSLASFFSFLLFLFYSIKKISLVSNQVRD